jgi:hypothetical protein
MSCPYLRRGRLCAGRHPEEIGLWIPACAGLSSPAGNDGKVSIPLEERLGALEKLAMTHFNEGGAHRQYEEKARKTMQDTGITII